MSKAKKEFNMIIRCDLDENDYEYCVEARDEDEAYDLALMCFARDYCNVFTKEEYEEEFGEED